MIEEITFKNALSFRDEATLSFEASNDKSLEHSHVVTMPNGTRLLRLGVVYGPNASGKSNFLYILEWLLWFCIKEPKNMDRSTGFEPFLLDKDTPNQPSEFSLKFWVNGLRYWYQLKVTSQRVLAEKLSYYKTTQPIMIFDRQLVEDQSVIRFNPSVQRIDAEEQKALTLNCLPNMSFFAARGRVNMKMEHVDSVRQWLKKNATPVIAPHSALNKFGEDAASKDDDFKRHVLDFLHVADFNITGLRNDIDEDEVVLRHTVENVRGRESYELNMKHQSAGTRRVMGIEAAIFESTRGKSLLMIDELETSLHSELLEYVIEQFLAQQSENQMLITTHYIDLMRKIDSLVRRDNIWFVEKDKAGSSSLYSLSDFKGLNQIAHFERAYRNGLFGALPLIKD